MSYSNNSQLQDFQRLGLEFSTEVYELRFLESEKILSSWKESTCCSSLRNTVSQSPLFKNH